MSKSEKAFLQFLKEIRPRLEVRIQKSIETLFERTIGKDSMQYPLKDSLVEYMLGGKFFRSSLVLYMYILYMQTDTAKDNTGDSITMSDTIVDISLSLEYLQAFLLMHDDIMDSDELRRGKPSFHVLMKNHAQEHIHSSSLSAEARSKRGESLAICMGDILFSYAVEIVTQHVPNSILRLLLQYYTAIIGEVGVAQMDDVLWGDSNIEPDVQEIMQMYAKKTGVYTFSLPMIMGFLLATCDMKTPVLHTEKELDNLYAIGEQMGILFQMKDDALELLYDANITGKNAISDIKQVKKTFVRSLLFEHSHAQGQKDTLVCLIHTIQSESDTQQGLRHLQDFMRDIEFHSILDTHFVRIKKYIEKQLSDLQLNEKAKQQYMQLLHFVIERKY